MGEVVGDIDSALDNLESTKNGEDPREESNPDFEGENLHEEMHDGRRYADFGGMSGSDPQCSICASHSVQFDVEKGTGEAFIVGCGVCGHRDPERGHEYTE